MELRPEFMLTAAAKSLVDVVLPAIDADNELAQEQAQLVVGTLQFLIGQMSQQFDYDVVDLSHLVRLADDIGDVLRSHATGHDFADNLKATARQCETVVSRALVSPAQLEKSGLEMRESICTALVGARASASPAGRRSIDQLVLSHAGGQTLRERAWVASQGWEEDPSSIPAIETLLSAAKK